jgi:hypothetical protein
MNASIYNCDTNAVYQSVLPLKESVDVSDKPLGTVQDTVKTYFKDPFVDIMLKNSHLTKIQFETVLIRRITALSQFQNASRKTDRGKMRLRQGGVSKGSFYRTLSQAKTNIDKAIFTVLLLGYVGILETPSLTPFLELSNKLKTYVSYIYDNKARNIDNGTNRATIIRLYQKRLVNEVKALIDA